MGYRIDLHCHTQEKSFDGQVSAKIILSRLHALGFSGVTFTDHSAVWQPEELEKLRGMVGLPPQFILLSGQEVRVVDHGVTLGDMLVYGPTIPFPDGSEFEAVWEAVQAAKGFLLSPHTGANRVGLGRHVLDYPVIAVEEWNGRYGPQVAARSREWADKAGLPGFGGSDTHKESDIGSGATEFPRLPNNIAALGEMLRQGECCPWRPGLLPGLRRRLGF